MIKMPAYLNASYEGDDLFTGDQVRELVNTISNPEQSTTCGEPVAEIHSSTLRWIALEEHRPTNALLYTTPPPIGFAVMQKPWVGLTHEDIDKAIEDNQRFGGFRKVGFAYDLENVLKEKNNDT